MNMSLTLSTLFITVGLSLCTVASEPEYRQLFDYPVRDTCICLVDGTYYLTGTTGFPTW